MAARSIWTGSIGFGLVNVPVRLYSATEDKNVRFHQLQEGTGKRVRYERVTDDGDEVPYEDIVKGYEVTKGKYVTLTDEELEAAEPAKSKTIGIEDFVDLHEIDPISFQKTYYVFPDNRADSDKPFVLLRRALEETERIGVGRFVMRDHEYLVALRPYGDVLALETMFFPDEVRDPKKIADPPKNVRVDKRELDMARRLIDSLATEWKPSRYHDTHRERLLDVIKQKSKGKEIVVEEQEEQGAEVIDLMEALRASLEGKPPKRATGSRAKTAKSASKRAAKKTAKRASKSTRKRAPAKKKAATKRRKAS
jgi:DNA end-binding protein Ku